MNSRCCFTAAAGDGGYKLIEIDETRGAAGTRRSLRMEFRLGRRASGVAEVLVRNVKRRDLTRFQGISFYLKATAPLRVGVQLMDSQDDNPHWEGWRAFVSADTEWRQHRVRFTDLWVERTLFVIPNRTNARLDLDRIEALVFWVPQPFNPGVNRATLWIDEVSFY